MAASTVPEPPERGTAAYIAEFIGTAALVFFITMAVSLYIEQAPQGLPQPFIDWSVIGLVHVFVLFMLIQTLALVCGAHFNPAVTAALTVIRQIKPIDAAIYIVVQLAGATLGALMTKGFLSDEGNPENYGAVAISPRTRRRLLGRRRARGDRHLLPRLGDRRRRGQPPRRARLGGPGHRRHARYGRVRHRPADGCRPQSGARLRARARVRRVGRLRRLRVHLRARTGGGRGPRGSRLLPNGHRARGRRSPGAMEPVG